MHTPIFHVYVGKYGQGVEFYPIIVDPRERRDTEVNIVDRSKPYLSEVSKCLFLYKYE